MEITGSMHRVPRKKFPFPGKEHSRPGKPTGEQGKQIILPELKPDSGKHEESTWQMSCIPGKHNEAPQKMHSRTKSTVQLPRNTNPVLRKSHHAPRITE
jgi:hypothetical protein